MENIEVLLARWQPEIARMARKNVPGMTPDDVEQELTMAFISAYRNHDEKQGPFENYVRVCLKNKRIALLRYAYSAGRDGIYTFSDIMGEDDEKNEWMMDMLFGIQDAMNACDIPNWHKTICTEAQDMSTVHTYAVKMALSRATMADIINATQAAYTSTHTLVAEVLETVRHKHTN